jgi:CBS domain-containing protein
MNDPEPAATTVGARMTPDAVVVHADQPLQDAARLLEQHRIHGLPVVDGAGCLVGVVSQSDMLRARTNEHLWSSWPGLKVRHLMSTPALVIGADATLDEAAARMELERVHRLVVVADDGVTPVGIITTTDIVHAMVRSAPTEEAAR